MKISKKKNLNHVEVKADVRIPGTDIILEKGDRVEVLKERTPTFQASREIQKIITEYSQSATGEQVGEMIAYAVSNFLSTLSDYDTTGSYQREYRRDLLRALTP